MCTAFKRVPLTASTALTWYSLVEPIGLFLDVVSVDLLVVEVPLNQLGKVFDQSFRIVLLQGF